MAYSEFNLVMLKKQFGVSIVENPDLFQHVEALEISALLSELLSDQVPIALQQSTEKARSEFIIAPVLLEVRRKFRNQIGLFSGVEFNVDVDAGLRGVCDFLLSLSAIQSFVEAPVLIVVEAKNENIRAGVGQCAAEMIAAYRFNEAEKSPIPTIFGAVTTGSEWRFLKLQDNTITIDSTEYAIQQVEKIVGILIAMLREASRGQLIQEGKARYNVL